MTKTNSNLPLRIYELLRDAERLHAVDATGMMDTPPEDVFDRITSTVSLVLNAPVAQITFMDEHRQWLKSSIGFEAQELPTETSFCAYTLENSDVPTVSLDATKDPRFASNPFVIDGPQIRFYAGFPIKFNGQNVGTICAYDMEPHEELTPEQNEVLIKLSREVSDLLENILKDN